MNGVDLKERMLRVGAVKAADAETDLKDHLRLSVGERIEAAIQLSQAVMRATPTTAAIDVAEDYEVAAMTRMSVHLKRLLLV